MNGRHGDGPCSICDAKDGPLSDADIRHIVERMLEDGDLEEVTPDSWRLTDRGLERARRFMHEAGK